MHMIRFAVIAMALAIASTVLAQNATPQVQGTEWYESLFAPDLIGKPVRNASGTELAKIEEIARDPANGKLVAVLKTGGFMGFGGKHAVVPLAEIQKQDTFFVIPQGSKETLSARPDFDEKKYPPVTHFSMLGQAAK